MRELLFAVLILGTVSPAFAQSYRPLETRQDLRQRYETDRYQQFRADKGMAPLGGYQDRLGAPAPRDTYQPGYINQGHSQETQRERRDNPYKIR